jgi:hypothetical protein
MSHPAVQVPALQNPIAPQLVPSAALLHAVVLVAGWQTRQGFAGFGVPAA